MSRELRLDKEIAFLQEEFRSYFLMLIALLSGLAGLIYAVVSGEKPLVVLILGVGGSIFAAFLHKKILRIKEELYKNLDLLEENIQ